MILLHPDGRAIGEPNSSGMRDRVFFMHGDEVYFLICIDESSWFFSALFEQRAI